MFCGNRSSNLRRHSTRQGRHPIALIFGEDDMAKYLVTGGCGFIGSHLADGLIAAGHSVRILDHLSTGQLANAPDAAQLMIGDASDPVVALRSMDGMDGCFHLAAVASVERANMEWLATHRVNQSATIAILDAARATGPIPVVYASPAAVYGDNPNTPLKEDATTHPLNAYGADKLGCELHARVAGGVHGVPTMGLRFFNVYGPRQDPKSPYSGVISIFCDRISAGKPITIFGDGGQERDFVYVADVVRRLIKAMKHADTSARVYNVCTGQPTDIQSLANTIGAVFDTQPEIKFGPPRVGDIRRSIGNPDASTAALGALKLTPLNFGLGYTIGPRIRAA